MSASPDSRQTFRALFEEVATLPPEQREACIARSRLAPEEALRLRAMIAFDELMPLDPPRRAARLAALPEPLRARVEAMLSADRRTPLLARGSMLDAIERWREDDGAVAEALVGSCVGSFRLVDLVGHGGSSVVFRAERAAGAGVQTVALKLLRTGLYSAAAQRRFRREQAILARLTHPNIATLVEGGVSAAGIPYIAMEYVDGLPITAAADVLQLGVEQRLHWFLTLCRTIAAAHAALIVHRDLKPSNLLVDRDGVLKVLDFGIAKEVDDEAAGVTRTQAVVLTPGYAAPEQFAPAAVATTAIDVYALGVVLSELLTGQRLNDRTRASSAVLTAGAAAVPSGLPPRRQLAQRLRGDLDAILGCALAEDAALRYPTAAALADDIERCLDGKPVRAHPPSRWYRARKFAVRHRGALAVCAVLLAAIVATCGVVAWQAHGIAREALRAQSMRDFLLRVFSAAEPAGPRLAPPTVADVVRASIDQARHAAALPADVRVELVDALGGVLRRQGDVDGALRLLEDNYRSATATLGAAAPTTLLAGLGLALARDEAGQHAAARPLLDELIARGEPLDDRDLRARLLAASAELGTERFERERALAESARAVALCASGCSEGTRIGTLVTRGAVLASFQDDANAIPVLERAIDAQRAWYGGPHVEIATTLQTLSRACRRSGALERAEQLARESLAIVDASLPELHRRRSDALDTLRQVLIDTRQLDEAVALGRRIVAIDAATRGAAHPAVATDENTLGFTLLLQDEYAQAADHFRAALAIAAAIPDQRRTAIYQADLGYSLGLDGHPAQGIALIDEALQRFRSRSEVDWSEVTSALEKRGELQRRAGDAAAAIATYAEADALYRDKLPTAPPEWHARTLAGYGRSLADAGNVGAAAALSAALAAMPATAGRPNALRVEIRAALAEVLVRDGKATQAAAMLAAANAEYDAARGNLPRAVIELLRQANASSDEAHGPSPNVDSVMTHGLSPR